MWLFFFLFCSIKNSTSAYKFLGILPTPSPSHYVVGSALFKELVRRGHEVTLISPYRLKKPMANFREIIIPFVFEDTKDITSRVLNSHKRNGVEFAVNLYNVAVGANKAILGKPEVQALMRSNETFDAVICDVFLSESICGLSEHFNVPLIGLNTFGAITWNTDLVGSPSPPSYVPYTLLGLTDRMSLFERVFNLAMLTFERGLLDFYYLPKQAAVYKQHFPNAKRDMYEVRKNTALVLLNQHVSLSFSRPYVPNQIEVGGMHINRKSNPLPDNIKQFIEEAKHGVIYLSMGSNINSKDLPLKKRQAILETIRALKQRILWKFEDPNLEGKPANVFISNWFPQGDILAHPNVKIFITHGGLLGLTESIYYGKPVIGIPLYGDQFLNIKRAEANGLGIKLDFVTLSKKTFTNAIKRMLNNASYAKIAAEMSARYRDQPIQPLDLAVFWVEHVVRHKGAKYLHCAGLDLNFLQYHNLDAILILYGGIILILILIVLFLRCLSGLRYGRKHEHIVKAKRN